MQIRKSAGRRRVIARGAPARRVLLIEDDAVVRTILYEHLEEVGYRTDLATNGEEAIDYLASARSCDVILLDLGLPIMDGWAFRAWQLRQKQIAEIPVILITG